MGLLNSWRESLDILRPKNLKQFMLLTVNAWIQAWKVGWLFILISLLGYQFLSDWGEIVWVGVAVIFLISNRPSIRQKDTRYFLTMTRDYLLPILMVYRTLQYAMSVSRNCQALIYFGAVLSSAIFIQFFALFYLDTRPWNILALLRSLRNTIFFLWYNLILASIVVIFQFFIGGVLWWVMTAISSYYIDLVGESALLNPSMMDSAVVFFLIVLGYSVFSLTFAFWVNVYIKRVRDNPNLYV